MNSVRFWTCIAAGFLCALAVTVQLAIGVAVMAATLIGDAIITGDTK